MEAAKAPAFFKRTCVFASSTATLPKTRRSTASVMEKEPLMNEGPSRPRAKRPSGTPLCLFLIIIATLWWTSGGQSNVKEVVHGKPCKGRPNSPYGRFPQPKDPFRFIPCTNETVPPPLEDKHHERTWAGLFDPNPDNWGWGNFTKDRATSKDPYAGRGIYLCGYLDAPLDYQNSSDSRIVRLAVTKFQVSGLARADDIENIHSAGKSSARTLIVEPGGPGGSGTSYVWRGAETVTKRLSENTLDVLGWDPRGVNMSLPGIACFPFDAARDRWSLLTSQYRYGSTTSPRAQLELADAMNNATFAACKETLGDLPRFVSTASVARDLEQIRIALGEPDVSGYFVSYGTGIGQTYANMYPDHVGRLILDGTEYVRDHRLLGGFGWTALDNATNAWSDGFLGECVAAGPDNCALAKPQKDGKSVKLSDLESRMSSLFDSIATRPAAAFTPSSGPVIVTYSSLIAIIYSTLYNAFSWPAMAQALYDLEQGNATLIATMLDKAAWEYDPHSPCPAGRPCRPATDELGALVICADSYDAPLPPFEKEDHDGLSWWSTLWSNMTEKSWVSGDSRFYDVLPCRHYTHHFGSAAEVYRGDLNHTLSNPVLLIAETYDPATPLRNGRRLLAEMGDNARLIAHHGYGHSSRDSSKCTDQIAKDYVLHGKVPSEQETACYADEKPYRYSPSTIASMMAFEGDEHDILATWRAHIRDRSSFHPGLLSGL